MISTILLAIAKQTRNKQQELHSIIISLPSIHSIIIN